MNILPKKRWHVRTKENIARVRKDEAEAAEKEKQERIRTETADKESRLNILKQKSKERLLKSGIPQTNVGKSEVINEHVNLFANLEDAIKTTNKEHDKEVKAKQEEYEKQIGYLTYLGQDTNEALKKKNWYDVPPEASRYSRTNDIKDTYNKLVLKDEDGKPKTNCVEIKNGEVAWKQKQRLDPMNHIKRNKSYKLQSNEPNTKVHKKNKNRNDEKCPKMKLQKLREARLKREQQERCRTELFLKKLGGFGESSTEENNGKNKLNIIPKYNSQFNPELARQNYK